MITFVVLFGDNLLKVITQNLIHQGGFFILEIKCPICGHSHFVKAGLTTEKQRYKCLDCGRKFTALSNTIFHGQKLAEGKLRTLSY